MDVDAAQEFILKYHSKLKAENKPHVGELNSIIDQFNVLNFDNISFEDEIIEEILCFMAKSIPSGNDHLLSKFSSLLYFLLHKHKKSFTPSCAMYLTEIIIKFLNSCGEWVLNDVLVAFSALLSGHHDEIQKFYKILLEENGVFFSLLAPKEDISIQYNAFQCYLHLLEKKSSENFISDDLLSTCCEKFILVLKEKIESNSSDIISLKILISCLKCIQHIFVSKNIVLKNFGELLGVLKCTLFYGLPGPCLTDTFLHPTLKCPDPAFTDDALNDSDSVPYPKLRKKKRNRRSKTKKPAQKLKPESKSDAEENDSVAYKSSAPYSGAQLSPQKKFPDFKPKSSSSDSEFSDAENQASKIKSLRISVRQNAYQALQAVVKVTEKKVLFGYWSSFLPDCPNIPGLVTSQNIFTTILKDPSAQVRLSALSLLIEMLKGSKNFLSYADGRNIGHLSFTSLSSILASLINEVHRCLHLALLSENSAMILLQILKCYAVLCENVPYKKLNVQLLLKLLKDVKSLMHHKDIQIQAVCLSIFGAVVNSDQIPEIVVNIMVSSDFDLDVACKNENPDVSASNLADGPNMAAAELPWSISLCKNSIFGKDSSPLQIESLQFLSSLIGKYFTKIINSMHILKNIILFCFEEHHETTIQLYGAKLLDVFGRCVNNYAGLEPEPDSMEYLNGLVENIWFVLSEANFPRCLTNIDQQTLQSSCCDCLSTMPAIVFEKLPKQKQIFYVTVMLGLATDLNPNLRGSAIRCLGIYCLYPCLMEDISFLSDVADKLMKSVDDPNKNVRFKASWSLANLSNALFMKKDKNKISTEISTQFYYSVGMTCVQFSKDCDRIKANAVRALGNCVQYMPEAFLDEGKMQEFIQNACQSLQLALKSSVMKVCWNACYALGNVMKNQDLINKKIVHLEDILNSLIESLKSPNFKVRISAAQALTNLTSRESYDEYFISVWHELVTAIFSATDDVDFKEIKHQENLCDQLCHSISLLVPLISSTDIHGISENIFKAYEKLLTSFWKFGSRTSKEKVENVYIAIEHLTLLMEENRDYEENKLVLSTLQDILNQSMLAFYGSS